MSRLQGVTPCKRLNAKIFSQCCCNPFIRGTRYFTTLRSVQYELRGRCHFEQSEKSQKKTQTLLLSALLEVLPLESSRGLHPLAP